MCGWLDCVGSLADHIVYEPATLAAISPRQYTTSDISPPFNPSFPTSFSYYCRHSTNFFFFDSKSYLQSFQRQRAVLIFPMGGFDSSNGRFDFSQKAVFVTKKTHFFFSHFFLSLFPFTSLSLKEDNDSPLRRL